MFFSKRYEMKIVKTSVVCNSLILYRLYHHISFLCFKTYTPTHVRSIYFSNFAPDFGLSPNKTAK